LQTYNNFMLQRSQSVLQQLQRLHLQFITMIQIVKIFTLTMYQS